MDTSVSDENEDEARNQQENIIVRQVLVSFIRDLSYY